MRLRKNSKHSDEKSVNGRTPKRNGFLKKRAVFQQTCATPNCINVKRFRRKLAGKTNFYCEVVSAQKSCSAIIDSDEYCHICFQIGQGTQECISWVQCEACNTWNHVECEEKAKHGIKNLTAKLMADQEKYAYKCLNCRVPQANALLLGGRAP